MQSAKAIQASKIANATKLSNVAVKVPELYDIERGTEQIPESVLEFLLFEQIGGQELLLLSRTDMLNGQNVAYQPINNLRDVAFQYGYDNIISVPGVLPEIFKQYGIVLETYVPDVDPNNPTDKSPWLNAYIEDQLVDPEDPEVTDTVKALVLEFQNIQENMSIVLEILESGEPDMTAHGLA